MHTGSQAWMTAALLVGGLTCRCFADGKSNEGFISFVPARKPYAVVDMTGSLLVGAKSETHRRKTPRGEVSVTFLPVKPSHLPPARHEEITWPVFDHTAEIRSPKVLPVLVKVPHWHPRTKYPIRVNGKEVPFRNGRPEDEVWLVWLRGGTNKVTFFKTDWE